MNTAKFSDALGELDTKYVDEAISYKRRTKRRLWLKWGAVAASLVAVIAVAIPFFKVTQDRSPTDSIQRIDFNGAYYEVCKDGEILERLGIDADITEKDAGEVVAYLTKKTPDGQSEYIPAEEPGDIILYSYAAAPCGAVYVICDNGEYDAAVFCNFVVTGGGSIPLARLYELYGIEGPSDISSISVVDGWFKKNIIGAELTDAGAIAGFYSASLALEDYSNDEYHELNYGHIATEEELLKAYERTSENKVTIMLETAKGFRFCLEFDAEGGWVYSGEALSYYKATGEMADWFSKNLN